MINETSSRAIDWLRFPQIVVVLAVHIQSGPLPYALTILTLAEGNMEQGIFTVVKTALEQIGFMI